jgi:hypothetical protein
MAIYDSPLTTSSDEILDFLLSQPTPEQVIALRASLSAQERLRYLLDTNREGVLTDAERAELDMAIQMDNLVARLKARAHLKLSKS